MNKFTKALHKLFTPIDMTQGKPYKAIILFAIPILLSNIIQQIYSITDAIIVGQTIPQQFAGINDTGPLTFLIFQFAFGISTGLSVAIASRFSKKDYISLRKSIAQSLIIALSCVVILTTLGLVFINPLLKAVGLEESIDPITYKAAKIYMMTITAGMIGSIAYNLIINICRSLGDSVTPLLFLIISNVINIILDITFALTFPTPEWKVFGVALATIIAQIISSVTCFIYTFKKYKFIRLSKKDFHFPFKDLLYHLKISVPLGFQFSILAIGLVIMQNAVVKFDIHASVGLEEAIHYAQDGIGAAYKLNNFLNTIYSALSATILAYVAQNNGINNIPRIKKGIKQGLIIGVITYLIVSTLGLLLTINGAFVYLFLKTSHITQETIKYGSIYLWVTLPLGIALFLLLFFRNAMQGFAKPLFPFLAGILELVARILACIYFPVWINPSNPYSDLSFGALAFADAFAWICACFILIIPFFIILKKKTKEFEIQNTIKE